jgi:hypothetical protein
MRASRSQLAATFAAVFAAVPTATATAHAQQAPLTVEVTGVPASMFVQEVRTVVVRVAIDSAWFTASSVPLFPQRLDQPFHVTLPWLQAAEDRAVEILPPAKGAATQQVAVGDRVVPMQRAGTRRDGERSYDVLELHCRWLALAAGTSNVAPVQVRYAFATKFHEESFLGRQPIDRQEATVASPPATIVVRNLLLPRPPSFTGAVGEFAVQASASVATVAVGDTFAVTLTVTGSGNLERFQPPAPERLPGFHVQGVVERRAPDARHFVFDVMALRAGVTAVPPLAFVAFVPSTGEYVTLRTAPVPITVTPAKVPLPPRVEALVTADAEALAAAAPARAWPYAVALVLVFAVFAWRRQKLRHARGRVAAAAAQRVAYAFAEGPAALLPAFEAALAATAGRDTFTPALFDELGQRHGASPAAALQRLHHAIDAARFGGVLPARDELLAALAAVAPR